MSDHEREASHSVVRFDAEHIGIQAPGGATIKLNDRTRAGEIATLRAMLRGAYAAGFQEAKREIREALGIGDCTCD